MMRTGIKEVDEVDLEILTERNRHLSEIERDCHSLHDLQTTLSTFVEEQSELIDQAEREIADSAANTGEAVEALEAATEYESRSLRKRWVMSAASIGITVVGVGLTAIFSPVIGIVTMGVGFGGLAVSQTIK